jgi:16S rRNA (guanine527-N7)-methyltransferase
VSPKAKAKTATLSYPSIPDPQIRLTGESLRVVEITAQEKSAAEVVFKDRLDLAERYVGHLATSGMERGLLGPREVPRLWGRHVLNCAVVADLIPADAFVADVGSGAGLPGLTFALARPDLKITLIEPLERRVNWLNEVIEDLGLENVSVLRARAEAAVGQVKADVVTARAVSALNKLAPLTIPLLEGRGEVLAIKGRSAAEELEKAAKVIRKLGGTETSVVSVGSALLEEPTTVVRIVVGH